MRKKIVRQMARIRWTTASAAYSAHPQTRVFAKHCAIFPVRPRQALAPGPSRWSSLLSWDDVRVVSLGYARQAVAMVSRLVLTPLHAAKYASDRRQTRFSGPRPVRLLLLRSCADKPKAADEHESLAAQF
jgi:hypothetical protein